MTRDDEDQIPRANLDLETPEPLSVGTQAWLRDMAHRPVDTLTEGQRIALRWLGRELAPETELEKAAGWGR